MAYKEMTYEEILIMISNSASNYFCNHLNYDGMRKTIVECATKVYIEQMQLEYKELQEAYAKLYEGHDKLSYDWAQLKKENKELNKKCNELLEDFNKINSEPLLRKMTIAELKERGFLRNESE